MNNNERLVDDNSTVSIQDNEKESPMEIPKACLLYTSLERNLYLAAQLLELEKPMVIALNMSDVAEEMGIKYDFKKMAELTGATIVSTVGRTNIGTKELLEATISVAASQKAPGVTVNYGDLLEGKIAELVAALEEAGTVTYPLRCV